MINPFETSSQAWPTSHYDLINYYHAQYDRQIASGEYQPFLYPWGTFGAFVVIVYLLIPHQHRPWLKSCRNFAFLWITGFAAYTTFYTRAMGMAPALGVGLLNAWSVCWVSAILVCNDAQTDFQRIERLEGVFGNPKPSVLNSSEVMEKQHGSTSASSTNEIVNGTAGPASRNGEFAWQPYPLTPFIERLDWVLDIFCNFRGAGWNWRTSALPPPPKCIQEQLQRNSVAPFPKTSNRIHAGQVKSYPSLQALIRANIRTLITGYLTLDALKTIMMHDRYFWGIVDSPPPSTFPYTIPYLTHPILTNITRLTLSMLAVKTALQTIFSLAPLIFAGLLGPMLLGARAEPWMYPETWASYSIVLDKGLAGWWSSWWHQTFRFAFEQPSKKIVERMGWERGDGRAKAVQLGVAFGLSGVVHACGSLTCAGETRPLGGPMLFFFMQAMGIMAEVGLTQVLKSWGMKGLPRDVSRIWTFVYVHVWFYFTARLLCDDFARGGVWLFEPIPVSLFRGLGFGVDPKDGWWCWWGVWGHSLRWHSGKTWWTCGLAF